MTGVQCFCHYPKDLEHHFSIDRHRNQNGNASEMIKKVVIWPNEAYLNNNLFEKYEPNLSVDGWAYYDLARELRERGYKVLRIDEFLNQGRRSKTLLISEDARGNYGRSKNLLRNLDVIPAVCISLEVPIIAFYFYHFVGKLAGSFEHVFLWPGCKEILSGTHCNFHPMYFPNRWREVFKGPSWSDRLFITMLNANCYL